MFIDTHAHLDFPEYDSDREEVLKRSLNEGVEYIINVGTSLETSRRSVELAKKYDMVYTSVGIHPHYAEKIDANSLKELEGMTGLPKVVAIGETGLDFYKNLSPKKTQEEVFRYSIDIARRKNLPLIIHSRMAQEQTLKILENNKNLRGVMHCFSYTEAVALAVLEMGLYISFAGQVTFPKAQDLRDIVKKIPLERILLETDCPFLAPQKFRGKRNEPAYVKHIALEISSIYGIKIEELGRITSANAKELFKIG